MSRLAIDSADALRDWFRRSGVAEPLQACIGPLPQSGASIARWARQRPAAHIQTVPPHPDSYRIALMLEPLESQIWVGDQPVWGGVIGAQRFRICPPGSASRWRQISGCDIVNLFVPMATVERLAAQAGLPPERGLSASFFTPDRQVTDLVDRMLGAQSMTAALAAPYCDGLMQALLCHLLERYAEVAPAVAPSTLGGQRLRRLLNHIAAHLGEDLPIAGMAELCAMSEAHFSREFHRALGLPPHQYLMKQRLERAGEALLGSEARIVDIALELGFHNASHFSRAFSQRFGLPPASYRRERRERPLGG